MHLRILSLTVPQTSQTESGKDSYFKEIKIAEHKEIKKIDTILKRNRRILKRLFNPKKPEMKFNREELIKAGLEFGFHTHIVVTRTKANEIVFCYDYGYREGSINIFQLFPSFGKGQVKNGGQFAIIG